MGFLKVVPLDLSYFSLFINDLAESCDAHSEIYLFADDAKLFRHITQESDKQLLQHGTSMVHLFVIYKTGVTNGCLNLIHQNTRSYPSLCKFAG